MKRSLFRVGAALATLPTLWLRTGGLIRRLADQPLALAPRLRFHCLPQA